MAEEKKKGIFSMLFGTKKPCCGDMKIEEVTEEEEKEPEDKSKTHSTSSCCDKGTKRTD